MNRIAVGIIVLPYLSQQSPDSFFCAAIDQQANLSQLASLAGVQNDATQQQLQLQETIDPQVTETAIGVEMGNVNLGNSEFTDNSGGSNTSF